MLNFKALNKFQMVKDLNFIKIGQYFNLKDEQKELLQDLL